MSDVILVLSERAAKAVRRGLGEVRRPDGDEAALLMAVHDEIGSQLSENRAVIAHIDTAAELGERMAAAGAAAVLSTRTEEATDGP